MSQCIDKDWIILSEYTIRQARQNWGGGGGGAEGVTALDAL